jgi:hypothetical protein
LRLGYRHQPGRSFSFSGSTVTFQWTTGTCVTDHFLYLGTAVGQNNIFGQDEGSSMSATVSGLPTNGSAVYLRLWSEIAGAWQYNDYTYTAVGGGSCAAATMTSPTNNSVLSGSTVTFQWTTGTCVTDHFLYVGTAVGQNNVFAQDEGSLTSAAVSGAYSGPCRSSFRADGDHDSGMMPIRIPG